ncbi:tail fiber domain-containing protein [Chryseobacterium sp. KACC 21268]|nr:tail fiber domain-containing protein [Chryseobacterium sp. KACC 21268]
MSAYCQMGINTTAPQAVLDITGMDISNPTNMDGLLIPRINQFPAINPTATQNSMLVYLSIPTPAASTFGINDTGFYYWNYSQLKWIGLDSSKTTWLLSGNGSTVDGINYIGTSDDVPLSFRINSQKAGRLSSTETFYGYKAGNSNVGNFNTAIGESSLFSNSTGNHIVAIGSNSMHSNLTGTENTAVGANAMHDNTTASANTAIGYEALYSNTKSGENVAVGYQALKSNQKDSNTGVGYQSLFSNTNGDSNTGIGKESLRNSTTGNANTGLGREALRMNTSGNNNSGFGTNSLRNNTIGNDNTAGGYISLFSNEVGSGNSAYGINSLFHNLSGNFNAGFGKETLYNNTTGNHNVAMGFASLYSNTTGDQNIAIGMEAARDNISGTGNIIIGNEASRTNQTGNNNVAIGNSALYNNNSGSNNTAIGHQADVLYGNLTNSMALGNGAQVNQSNKVRIGNNDITIIEGFVAMTVASDRRYKKNIKTISLGLDFINRLNPVEYIKTNNSEKTKEWGLIAQELQETLKSVDYNNAGLISSDKTKENFLSVRYTDLLAPMIRSIQELSEMYKINETLQKTIKDQQRKIDELCIKLEDLENRLNALSSSK